MPNLAVATHWSLPEYGTCEFDNRVTIKTANPWPRLRRNWERGGVARPTRSLTVCEVNISFTCPKQESRRQWTYHQHGPFSCYCGASVAPTCFVIFKGATENKFWTSRYVADRINIPGSISEDLMTSGLFQTVPKDQIGEIGFLFMSREVTLHQNCLLFRKWGR